MTSIQCDRAFCSVSLVGLVLLMTVAPSLRAIAQDATPAPDDDPVTRAVAWLATQQARDGGFVGFSGDSDPGVTADAVIALAAAGGDDAMAAIGPARVYLETHALVYAQTGAGQAAKLVLAVLAIGGDPTSFATVNPLALAMMSADATGLYGSGIFDHALIMLAIVGAGEDVPPAALDALRATQNEDGSWAFDGSVAAGAGDTNTTALVVQALVAAGHVDDPMIAPALAYLKTVQAEDGGFSFQPADPIVPDANSTALVVQAIIAFGQDPASDDWKNAAGALAAFQNESGAFRYNDDQPDDNLFATLQAIPAVAGLPLPIRGVASSEEATPSAGRLARRAA